METAFIVGLTSGGSCLASCGPLAAALLASEEITLRRSSALLSAFLSGRLLGYLCWAVLSWLLGWLISQSTKGFALFSAADLVLGAWLIYYGIRPPVPKASWVSPIHNSPTTSFEGILMEKVKDAMYVRIPVKRWVHPNLNPATHWKGFFDAIIACPPALYQFFFFSKP